jgi:hypothetical protein
VQFAPLPYFSTLETVRLTERCIHPDDEALYHCPTAGCKATFKTLTATIAHLESDRHDTNQVKLEKFLRNIFL